MSTKTTAFNKLPGVFAMQRGAVITDATLYNVAPDGSLTPVPVIRHGLRGTQNVNTEKTKGSGPREVANPQTTESAKLDPLAKALAVTFGFRTLPLESLIFSCANSKKATEARAAEFKQELLKFMDRSKSSAGLLEVVLRYARNILNARWLWRNRVIANTIRITITEEDSGIVVVDGFDALSLPLNAFDNYLPEEKLVADYLLRGLMGERSTGLQIQAMLTFGVTGSVEVFPSQNMLLEKARGFARSLYYVGHPEKVDYEEKKTSGILRLGHAAIRDQKVGNALRTIDTWYADYDLVQRPIAVEPKGANLDDQEFYRESKDDVFKLLRGVAEMDPDTPEGMFCLAAFIRGGVFSEAEDKPKNPKDAPEDQGEE